MYHYTEDDFSHDLRVPENMVLFLHAGVGVGHGLTVEMGCDVAGDTDQVKAQSLPASASFPVSQFFA